MVAELEKYEIGKGLEDGFEPLADVVTKMWIVTDNLVRITNKDGVIVCPYITIRRGRTVIQEGDYIVVEEDGAKLVCGEDKVDDRYEKI
ncbi:MAG: hypothetical protein J6Z02_04675 [Lachnospiraceae bacterium]|nr:hypothetical protein [Lachnospiraceae bacterium]